MLVLHLWTPIPGEVWRVEGTLGIFIQLSSDLFLIGAFYSIFSIDVLVFFGFKEAKGGFSAKGPYAYCRHPMYLFFGGCVLLTPIMTMDRMVFLVISGIYVAIAIPLEERSLREELGEIYDKYRENVPVIIPRLSPWKPNEIE